MYDCYFLRMFNKFYSCGTPFIMFSKMTIVLLRNFIKKSLRADFIDRQINFGKVNNLTCRPNFNSKILGLILKQSNEYLWD